MSPRADSGLTLVLFGLVFTGELLALCGLILLAGRVGRWARERFQRGKTELDANVEALQARYDDRLDCYDDVDIQVARRLHAVHPGESVRELADFEVWKREVGA